MNSTKVTPKDFFLWIGAMIALYISVFSLLTLFFEYIDHAIPDKLNYYVDPYSGAIRFAIASLVVLFPVFLMLMRLIRKDIAANPSKADLWIRRWALYLTIFVAGATIVIDLIALVNTYLGGDISTRFGLKVLMVFLVAGAGFLHFLADLRGYWIQYPGRARVIGWGAGAVTLATIVAGFFIIGSPSQVRLARFDDQKVNDLMSMQWQVVSYWQAKQKLPDTVTDLNDPLTNYSVPKDPQTGIPYRYEKTGSTSFTLCAVFNRESMQSDTSPARQVPPYGEHGMESWQHAAGEQCFTRTIDPARYPPTPQKI